MSKQSTRSSKSPKFSKVSFRFKSVSSKVRSSFVRSAYSGILAKHDGPADNKKEKTLMPLAYLEPELFECLLERDKRKVKIKNHLLLETCHLLSNTVYRLLGHG